MGAELGGKWPLTGILPDTPGVAAGDDAGNVILLPTGFAL